MALVFPVPGQLNRNHIGPPDVVRRRAGHRWRDWFSCWCRGRLALVLDQRACRFAPAVEAEVRHGSALTWRWYSPVPGQLNRGPWREAAVPITNMIDRFSGSPGCKGEGVVSGCRCHRALDRDPSAPSHLDQSCRSRSPYCIDQFQRGSDLQHMGLQGGVGALVEGEELLGWRKRLNYRKRSCQSRI